MVNRILDEGLVCHVGWVRDGRPVVIPTLYARVGETLFLHGSPASSTLRGVRGLDVCVTVTLVDGLVLARSAFNSSVNYRSVVVMGRASEVTDPEQKRVALDALVEHTLPGRLPQLRPMTDKETRSTMVLRLSIEEASAKVRSGPPDDDPADLDFPVWAGVLPLTTGYGPAEPDPLLTGPAEPPPHVTEYRRTR
jgi:nitroimidazol reductase NimA-like FMN-containing flavoprotein (pyridoxamine 5'-phosphate oxidase superfamily)